MYACDACMHVIHACVNVRACVDVCACMHVIHACVNVRACVDVCACVWIYVHVWSMCMYACVRACMHV